MPFATACFAAVDVNKATAAELDSIAGIGPTMSAKIIDERKKGNFRDWNDFITRMPGLGGDKAAKFSAEGLTVHGASLEPAKVAAPAKNDENTVKPYWFVTEFGIDNVNSAGGVEPYFVFFNPYEGSRIKYIRLRVRLFNAVGDAISSEIGGRSSAVLSYTGPLANEDGKRRTDWGPIWYNSTGHCIKVEAIQVTFVGGKSVSFAEKELKRALHPSLSNDCKMK